MIRLAANLSYLFTDLPFLDRFAAAARAGFEAVEYNFAYDIPIPVLRAYLRDNHLSLVLLNTPPGDMEAGELGLAVLPGREKDLAAAFETALEYAVELDAPLIHFLAGKPLAGADPAETDRLFLDNIRRATARAASVGKTIALEPLNSRDRPGYDLTTNAHARRLIEASGQPNVKLQLDLYHCQIAEGDLIRTIERNFDLIAHVQIAGVPDRGEPNRGEIAIAYVFERLEELGYAGHIGLEYIPAADTLAGLAWASPYLEGHDAV